MLNKNAIDIVITDIRMPGMNGIELIKKINSQWKMTKCILLTGYAEFDYAREALHYKATDYLLKPVQEDELITCCFSRFDGYSERITGVYA